MKCKKILVAPLDWGLGHATRCIPVIRELVNAGHEVLIAADGRVENLLRGEFFQIKFIYLEGYRLSYSSVFPAWMKIIFQLPKIIYRMCAEHRQLKKIIRDHNINVVVSDGRFGLWNKGIRSVYITHQVMIKCPNGLKFFEPLLYFLHRQVISKYNHCWIPDYGGKKNLSGDLSHFYRIPTNARFINPLSRFGNNQSEKSPGYDLCIIISGPEPSRSSFEKAIRSQLTGYSGKAILILGKPGHKRDEQAGNHRIISHLNAAELEKIIAASKMVICRSGYSGIMDLIAMKKDALLIPTPGQTEQEYLAKYLSSKKIFRSISQNEFRLAHAVEDGFFSVNRLSGGEEYKQSLKEAIQQLTDF